MAISPSSVDLFTSIAVRERCPFGIVGTATSEQELVVTDRLLGKDVIRLGMGMLFGKPPRMHRTDEKVEGKRIEFDGASLGHTPVCDADMAYSDARAPDAGLTLLSGLVARLLTTCWIARL